MGCPLRRPSPCSPIRSARIFADQDHSEREPREIIVGYSARGRLLVVSFTERVEVVRLISARVATRREHRRHEENRKA
jgi:uncharacterized DUF497 family protein